MLFIVFEWMAWLAEESQSYTVVKLSNPGNLASLSFDSHQFLHYGMVKQVRTRLHVI